MREIIDNPIQLQGFSVQNIRVLDTEPEPDEWIENFAESHMAWLEEKKLIKQVTRDWKRKQAFAWFVGAMILAVVLAAEVGLFYSL